MRVHRLVILSVAWAVASAASGFVRVGDEPAPHGATNFDVQQRALDALLAGVDATQPPLGVDPMVWAAMLPNDNGPTAERIALGRKLYFDPRLSKDGTVSCATCHDVLRGFTDRRPVSEGIGDKLGRRNAPTSVNAALLGSMFWDGRAATLEDQAKLPIINPIEMGFANGDEATAAIAKIPEYGPLFQAAYGRAPNYDDIGRAIGAFERTLIFVNARFDAHRAGKAGALSPAEANGLALYEGKARCATCHPLNGTNPVGSDHVFHNIGVSARHQDFEKLATRALAELTKDSSMETIDRLALETDLGELGRFVVTRNYADIGGFRTPSVRNVGITAPYMHDGSMQTLWDVVDHYNKGGEANPWLDGGIEPLALTESEINDLVAFLFALTDERFADANAVELKRQAERAQSARPFRDDGLARRERDGFEDRLGSR
jgi:cytochrome c peroxidase